MLQVVTYRGPRLKRALSDAGGRVVVVVVVELVVDVVSGIQVEVRCCARVCRRLIIGRGFL